jgi:hypothetical protein
MSLASLRLHSPWRAVQRFNQSRGDSQPYTNGGSSARLITHPTSSFLLLNSSFPFSDFFWPRLLLFMARHIVTSDLEFVTRG